MTLDLSIIVPDRVFWKGTVKEVILTTLTGQMGVLTNHIPLLTGLDIGLLLIYKESLEDMIVIVVTGGFALINNNKLTILVSEAELGSEIDSDQANNDFLSNKSILESVLDEKKKIEVNAQYKKARARLQAVQILNSK